MKYPVSKREPIMEVIHGKKIVDNYRWLEDGDSPKVQRWVQSQNTLTDEVLSRGKCREELREELKELFEYDSFSLPGERAGWYFWKERKAGQNQFAIYKKYGLDGAPTVIIDPNTQDDNDTVSITSWTVSPNGNYMTYSIIKNGAELESICLYDLNNNKELDLDSIPYSSFSSVTWLEDESGFFYTRTPDPDTVDDGDEHYYSKVYLHKVGRSYKNDELIFGKGRHKEDMYSIHMSDDRRTLIINAQKGWTSNEVWVYDLENSRLTNVIKGLDGKFCLSIVKQRAYMWTDYRAEYGRVLATDIKNISSELDTWDELLPQRDYNLEGITFTKDFILAKYTKDVHSSVEVLDHAGKKIRNLDLPEYATLSGLSCKYDSSEFFYGYTDFLNPAKDYRYNPETKKDESYRSIDTPINPKDYQVSQQWYQSKDGTRVPMFVIAKHGVRLNSNNPTLLYGYGGFALSSFPQFARGILPFLKRGGVYVVANIRGGGEFGKKWHEDGIVHNKQNSFDDFIGAAEYLIEKKYTTDDRLAIQGASNGGLLVGACMAQRPDLFKAVVCQVPLLDMVRFPRFLIASRWTNEYGDPGKKEDFDYILRYSPYHNVNSRVEYPATLFMTADHDTRVDPLHARKMAALLQSVNKNNPILIRTDVDTGHGAGIPINKWVHAQADKLTFIFNQLSM